MKNEQLHQSEELAKHFANYRDEAPLLYTPQIEKLLARRDMLPNQSTKSINVRRIIMTLAGITGLAAIAYFAFFNIGPQRTQTTYGTPWTQPQRQQTFSIVDSTQQQKQIIKQTPTQNNGNGPWSAGNDQYYADLTPEQLQKLGIIIQGDTIVNYRVDKKYGVEIGKVAAHYIQGMGQTTSLPAGIEAHHFFPELITFANGNGAAWRTDSSCSIMASEVFTMLLPWLKKPGTPGYHALGFTNHHEFNGVGFDTLRLEIGKDFSQPPPMPFVWSEIDKHWDSVKDEVMQLAHYYEGDAPKPTGELPKNFTLAVDTVTPQDLMDQFAQEQNCSTMEHIRSIMSRLNELVPVIVRMTPGTGKPSDKDFILWYEPSEELFSALPEQVAKAERARLAEPPHCLSAPDAVLTTVDITYCVNTPQIVQLAIQDLTGKQRISCKKESVAGDNVWKVGTETLPSGMYLVTVRDADSTERTRRIWVENANPKMPGWEMAGMKSDSKHSIVSYTMFPDDSTDDGLKAILNIPHLELDMAKLAEIGIESNDSMAAFYQAMKKPGDVADMQIMRKGAADVKFLKASNISLFAPPSFRPLFVTDGKGYKRVFMNDSVNSPSFDTAENLRKFRDIDRQFREIDQLIPILLRADNTSDSVGARDLIFWYKPTPEFLAALPDSARGVAQQMIGGNASNTASVEQMQGAISKAVAYPNPSKGRFSVDMTLDAPRTLTFTLRNLLGQQVGPPVTAHSEGVSTQTLDFESAGEGVYLLDITSDAGERFVQRVVIAR